MRLWDVDLLEYLSEAQFKGQILINIAEDIKK